MSTFRKKSSSGTDESSSSSSTGSSSSSGSSSCSDSGSSSESESTSTVEEKTTNPPKVNESAPKSQVITRRKSSEVKSAAGFKTVGSVEKVSACPLATSKLRSTNSSLRLSRNQEVSSEDEVPPVKKNTKLPHNVGTGGVNPRKKPNSSATQQHTSQNVAPTAGEVGGVGGGGGKAPPAVVKQHQIKNFTAAVKANTNKTNTLQNQTSVSMNPFKLDESTIKDNIYPHFSTVVSSDNTDNEFPISDKQDKKSVLKPIDICIKQHAAASISSSRVKTTASKAHPKRNVSIKSANAPTMVKSSEESESESGTTSGEGSSSSSGSDHSESSNSSASQNRKKSNRAKRNLELTSEDKDDKQQETKGRKLTRSLSTRRSKNYLIRGGGAGGGGAAGSETDSDVDAADVFSKFSKSPTKKPLSTIAATKATPKKDSNVNNKNRSQSPQPAMEKKCPIEGCDSSGHLSGNQDRHFLSEACPIYHNMSASECKERANERKQREEFRQKTSNVGAVQQEHSTRKSLTADQKDFLSKIRESRMRFRPTTTGTSIINTEKIKVEKDCPDDDREPCLSGLVPDYDLQLFREAQAIASEKIEDELKDLPVGKGIRYITMGKYKMKVWYQSPYPDDAARLPKMYICEFCLRYQKSETGIKRHAQKCVWRHPPGDEIYRKGKLQVWQVDGKRHKQYCQHLCLLAKFFLDHKTLYYDVEPFLFYIMTLADIDGCHTVGYFSKEKNSFYNVSCILTLPPYQRKGYGRLLIDFSYLLTRVEGKIGSPEKPLSDLGLISYRSYWKDVLLDYLCNRSGSTLSIKDVSQEMAIYSYDIVSTLQALGMMKYWKGKHIVLKKQDVLDEYDERVKRRGNFPKIDDSCLRWSPFVPPQTNASP